jgi:O-antigen ligase/polysaccharide polymerase Wzy-like membrane protein
MLCRVVCALLFVAWTAEWPLAIDPILYCGHWRSPFELLGPLFVSVPGVNLFPWQLILVALTPVCLLWPGAFRKRAWAMDAAIVISVASIALTFLWGWMRGGSAYNAYYQLWRFLVGLLVGLLLLSVIRRSRDLKIVGFTVLLAALVRGTLCIYFYWEIARGKIDPLPPYMTTHDDSLLFVAGVLIALSWAVARGTVAAWAGAVVASAWLAYAIVLNDRRLAWVELLLVLVPMFLLTRGRVRRRMTRYLLLASPALLAYVVVGWGREEAIFAPIQALASTSGNGDNSTLARQEEVRNLLYTMWVAGNPILGTGWGVPYQKVTSVYANFGAEWWQYAYLPHNSLLAVAVFGGLVGIAGIWLVVPVAAFLAARGYRGGTRPAVRAGAMAAVCILPAYAAQCYGDIGFQSLTGSLILGVAMAVAGKVGAWAEPFLGGARTGTPVAAAG